MLGIVFYVKVYDVVVFFENGKKEEYVVLMFGGDILLFVGIF